MTCSDPTTFKTQSSSAGPMDKILRPGTSPAAPTMLRRGTIGSNHEVTDPSFSSSPPLSPSLSCPLSSPPDLTSIQVISRHPHPYLPYIGGCPCLPYLAYLNLCLPFTAQADEQLVSIALSASPYLALQHCNLTPPSYIQGAFGTIFDLNCIYFRHSQTKPYTGNNCFVSGSAFKSV
ncbi:hypothetical protein NXS19_001520 [Fusarium pseudograminearum]|nr:hypothetical protein NXS19_001520 [Fusarium pseudograminearum]